MTKIGISNISEVKLNVIGYERRYDSDGDLAIHPAIKEVYRKKGYDLAPKTPEEARARGARHWNGLATSIPRMAVYYDRPDSEAIVTADIAPTRYLIGQALRDILKEKTDLSVVELNTMNPRIANVSLIAPIKVGGKYHLLSQIKGKALDSGQVHAALVAGGVEEKHLHTTDPLISALKSECTEELGIDLSYFESTSHAFMLDEPEYGYVNFASIARNTKLDEVLKAYEADSKRKLLGEKLEVMALSFIPIGGLALTPLEKGNLENIICYHPTPDGLKEMKETRKAIAYTEVMVEHLNDAKNARFVLERAGF